MAEYIEKKNTLERLRDIESIFRRSGYSREADGIMRAEREIERIPSSDAAPVIHAQWGADGIAAVCSLCKSSIVIEQYDADLNYCPNCGAKMDEEGQ